MALGPGATRRLRARSRCRRTPPSSWPGGSPCGGGGASHGGGRPGGEGGGEGSAEGCVTAILARTDAAGAGAGVEEALNCWEEGAYEAETLEALAEFGD